MEGGSTITPRFPQSNEIVYDSSWENFFLMIFDSRKQLISSQDVYSKGVKLSEGSYTVRVQIVSSTLEVLEKLSTSILLIDYSLSKSLNAPCFSSLHDAVMAGGGVSDSSSFKKKKMAKGERTVAYVSAPDISNSKDIKGGDLLLGEIKVVGGGRKVDCGKGMGGNGLHRAGYIVPLEPIKSKEDGGSTNKLEGDEVKSDDVQLKEAIRDLEISWTKKCSNDESKKILLARLESSYPDHLPLLLQKLNFTVENEEKLRTKGLGTIEGNQSIVNVADSILKLIDRNDLALYYGVHHDSHLEKEKNKKKEKDKLKDNLVIALFQRTRALEWIARKLCEIDTSKESPSGTTTDKMKESWDAFDESFKEFSEWGHDPSSFKYVYLFIQSERKSGRFGTALKAANKFISETHSNTLDSSKDKDWRCIYDLKLQLLIDLQWQVWKNYECRWEGLRNPKGFAPF